MRSLTRLIRWLRLFLASRRLFRNWLWAGIEYFLTRRGLIYVRGIAVVCYDGFRDTVPVDIYQYLLYDNYLGIVKQYLCREQAIEYVGGMIIPVGKYGEYGRELVIMRAVGSGWSYDKECGCWSKDNVKLRSIRGTVLQVFEFNEYGVVDVNGKVIIDVGAYVGDSSIYFAIKGAKIVIAIEPYPKAYREMLENIKLNNLENKIVPVNAGLASKPGRVCLGSVDIEDAAWTFHTQGDCEYGINAVTLSEVLQKYVSNADNYYLMLKMDCEGCEYDIILNDYENVRRFHEIVFEYHEDAMNRPVTELLTILRKDYRCRFIRKGKGVGIVRCVRK